MPNSTTTAPMKARRKSAAKPRPALAWLDDAERLLVSTLELPADDPRRQAVNAIRAAVEAGEITTDTLADAAEVGRFVGNYETAMATDLDALNFAKNARNLRLRESVVTRIEGRAVVLSEAERAMLFPFIGTPRTAPMGENDDANEAKRIAWTEAFGLRNRAVESMPEDRFADALAEVFRKQATALRVALSGLNSKLRKAGIGIRLRRRDGLIHLSKV